MRSFSGRVAVESDTPDSPTARVLSDLAPSQTVEALARHRLIWEGPLQILHSFAQVNREICRRLVERGHELSLWPDDNSLRSHAEIVLPPVLTNCLRRPLSGPPTAHVRHQWPPHFDLPSAGHWVVIQPWEFGSLPRCWIRPFAEDVDEVWVPTHFVRDCFLRSGVPADRVHVVPNGVDPGRFHPRIAPLPLRTRKRFKFLFVGGTIYRKGIDLLLEAYTRVFTNEDDVCLVIKDMGVGTFYSGQTAGKKIYELQARPRAPEIEYLTCPIGEDEMAGLYTACDCLVHPYRGEGFGLPITEAMACGLPVIVTGYGAALDFCSETTAYLLPAREKYFPKKRACNLETVDTPWFAEPDSEALHQLLEYTAAHPEQGREKGRAAAESIKSAFTWDHTLAVIEARLEALDRSSPHRPAKLVVNTRNTPASEDAHGKTFSERQPMTTHAPRCVILVPTGGASDPPCEDGLRELERRGYPVWRVGGFPQIDVARNQMATDALCRGFDELMWIDTNVVFDPNDVEKLRSHNLPLVCGLYAKESRREFACAFFSETRELPFGSNGKLMEILFCGFGFVLTRRGVYEMMQQHMQLPVCNLRFGSPLVPFFAPLVLNDEEGAWYLTEDYAFCARARNCGFRVMADTTIRLWHAGAYRFGWEDADGAKERFADYTYHLSAKSPPKIPVPGPAVPSGPLPGEVRVYTPDHLPPGQ
jgi:glycosyltransferase involved in cell wall biosynthesis